MAAALAPELAIVVPTFNERANVDALLAELSATLQGIEWEVVFVDDDSTDGTTGAVRARAAADPRVRCLQRIGRRGLSSACIEGILSTSAPLIAVMDGDLQHDPALLPRMVEILSAGDVDLVVGSRYVPGGGVGAWDGLRARMSRVATRMARSTGTDGLQDPMSGYFMIRREAFDGVVRRLSGIGFKILLDIVASAQRPLVIRELPYGFRVRQHGDSKLDSSAIWDYAMLLVDKRVGHIIPVRFLSFALIGAVGVLVHVAVLSVLYRLFTVPFVTAQSAATVVAIVFNYSLNNLITYRDRRRRGLGWLTGLLSFAAICGIGAAANIGIAGFLFARRSEWLLAALAGVFIGAVWNYAATSTYTWGKPRAAS